MNENTQFADTDARIDYAQSAAADAGLTGDQVASMQAYILGATLTHFDESPPVPMAPARWRQIVRAAIDSVTQQETPPATVG